MPRNKKLFLLFASLVPPLYMIAFFVSTFLAFWFVKNTETFNTLILYFILAQVAATIWTIILLFIYIKNILKNPTVDQNNRALWIIAIIFFNAIAMPIYWYIHIWKLPETQDRYSAIHPT